MRFVAIDDVALNTAFRPPAEGAPTLVFANSLGTDFRIWQRVVERLPAALGVLLYDKRSHGLSQTGSGAETLARHVDDLAGLVAEARIGRHVVCGLSVGGTIAQGYAQGAPAGLAGLVLSNTAARIGTAQTWDERIETVRRDGLAAIADGVLERWFSPQFRAREAATYAGMRIMLTRQDAASYVAICQMLRDTDLRASVPAIAVPTLCIAGSLDLATPPALVEGTAALIPDAAYTLIEDVGHIPCVEVPAIYADRLTAFLSANGLMPA